MENGLALAHDGNGVHGTLTTEGNNGYPSLNGHTVEIPQAATQPYNPRAGTTATIVTEGMEEVTRGRTTNRDEHNDDEDTPGGSGGAGGESRADKRRRSRKGLDKKFTCPTENCGKQYSRAEHLYRHQLNHSPKAIYRCDFPGCPKHFVRQDLCVRHRERHATRTQNTTGRRESYAGNGQTPGPEQGQLGLIPSPDIPSPIQPPPAVTTNRRKRANTPDNSAPIQIKQESGRKMRRTSSDHNSVSKGQPVGSQHPIIKQEITGEPDQMTFNPNPLMPKVRSHSNPNLQSAYTTQPQPLASPLAMQPPMIVSTFPHQTVQTSYQFQQMPMSQSMPMSVAEYTQQLVTSASIYTSLPPTTTGTFHYYTDPYTTILPLFDENLQQNPFTRSPTNGYTRAGNEMNIWFEGGGDDHSATSSNHSFGDETFDSSGEPNQMHLTNFLNPETPAQAYEISQEKREKVLTLMNIGSFEMGLLTRKKMQEYIKNYWKHFHPQLPILHRPTWKAEEAHDALVGAVMMTGMLAVDPQKDNKADAQRVAQAISSSVRWSAFADADFDPPAKLWVFQALLILELFEKLFVTRIHHERAHVHHATTLTLMRRGTSFVDISPSGNNGDSPPRENDDRAEENAWRKWIHGEEMRRVAFAAFIVDANHAAMFGHSHHLIATELKIALPCDERLWEATSPTEKKKYEKIPGNRSIPFGEAVRTLLLGKPVKTTAFGRTCLMAGMLGLILYLSSQEASVDQLLGAVSESSNESRRNQLTKAVDLWKMDYERYVQEGYRTPIAADIQYEREQRARLAQHALAHLALNVDVIDLQIYAGAFKLLGRAVHQSDRERVQEKMRKWVEKNSKANDAVWHSLKFIRSVMMVDYGATRHASGILGMRRDSISAPILYDPNDDNLYHRPWILYFAALTVFAYALAHEGPRPAEEFRPIETKSHEEEILEMGSFLNRIEGVEMHDLSMFQNMTQCGSMLLVLARCFDNCRWELLREGAKTLRNSYRILYSQPPHPPDCGQSQSTTTPN